MSKSARHNSRRKPKAFGGIYRHNYSRPKTLTFLEHAQFDALIKAINELLFRMRLLPPVISEESFHSQPPLTPKESFLSGPYPHDRNKYREE